MADDGGLLGWKQVLPSPPNRRARPVSHRPTAASRLAPAALAVWIGLALMAALEMTLRALK